MNPVLCIVQARMGSKRFPGKMLRCIDGEALIDIATRKATEAFGAENVVVAIPDNPANGLLRRYLKRKGANVFAWDGPESDVLGRMYACALRYRREKSDRIFRYTPDDPFKVPEMMRAVADGETGIPVEIGGECFTFGQLSRAHYLVKDPVYREHLSLIFNPNPTPPPEGIWTIDHETDLLEVNREEAA